VVFFAEAIDRRNGTVVTAHVDTGADRLCKFQKLAGGLRLFRWLPA